MGSCASPRRLRRRGSLRSLAVYLAILASSFVSSGAWAQDAGVDAGVPMDAGAALLSAGDAAVMDAAMLGGDAAVLDGAVDGAIAPDAAADAGDAGAAAAAPEVRVVIKPTGPTADRPSADVGLLGEVMRLLSAEQEEEAGVAHPAEDKDRTPAPGELDRLLPDLPVAGFSVLGLLVLLALALLAVAVTRRVREVLSPEGLLPSVLSLVHGALQLSVIIMLLALGSRLLPSSLAPGGRFLLLAVAVAIGWSARDVLQDIIAGLVLTFERRIKGGMWVSGQDFEGLVERRSLRAMWVRDGHGNRIAVPNRRVLGTTVAVQEAPGPIHEVALRIDGSHEKGAIRHALREATITSPWVRPETAPTIRQDGRDPDVWHVRAALLEMRFAALFEGDLLERVEDVLAVHGAEAVKAAAEADDWD